MHGILQLPWWGYIVATLILTQITILGVTVFLHRCQAHRALELHPIVSHFFRFWLWLTTGMITKQWTSIHRKHHAKVETVEDPHSPQVRGIKAVFWQGAELYRKEKRNKETSERYGQGTPDDWIERNLYTAHSTWGVFIMLGIDLLLFGSIGLTIWAIQLAWIPFFAAGVINGIGHYFGYRNFECADASRNVFPFAFFIGGEELHNNHHTYGTSAKFSVKWWEFDMGWLLIRTLQFFHLAKPKRIPPKAQIIPNKTCVDIDTVKALLTHRFAVMSRYSKEVIFPVLREERSRASNTGRSVLKRMRTLLIRESSLVEPAKQQQLAHVLADYDALGVVYQFRLKLQQLWAKSPASQAELLEALQEWCRQAEATGIKALMQFVQHLKGYVPQRV
jgi:stearoyl-CoA desaturase (delta-9 desaturase)